jgi:hypothetical protein
MNGKNNLLDDLITQTYFPVKESHGGSNKIEFKNTDDETVGIKNPYLTFPYFCLNQILFLSQYHPIPNIKRKDFEFFILNKYKVLNKSYKFHKNGVLEIFSPGYFSKKYGFYFPTNKLGIFGAAVIFNNHSNVNAIHVKDTGEKYLKEKVLMKKSTKTQNLKLRDFLNNGLPLTCPNKLLYCEYSKSFCRNKCPYFNFCPVL